MIRKRLNSHFAVSFARTFPFSWLHATPLTSLHHWSDGKHSTVFKSARDDQLGRPVSFVCGLGLGGSTRINGGQYTCGAPGEFNAWSRAGLQGWSYADLKPYFDKSESWIGSDPREYHGTGGASRSVAFMVFQSNLHSSRASSCESF